MSPTLLAIETATEACSAALIHQGVTAERYQVAPRQHAQLIMPMIDELVAEADITLPQLDAIVFSRGPGSFTGVRIGAALVQGLAFAAALPVIPISTLAALAQGAAGEQVIAAIDARMQEIYWCAYARNEKGLVRPLIDEQLVAPARFDPPEEGAAWCGVGSGWASYEELLRQPLAKRLIDVDGTALPRASALLLLGEERWHAKAWVPASEALPRYLRDQVVQTPKKRG